MIIWQVKDKSLNIERYLKLEELAKLTKISKSALGSYENDVKKETSHQSILKLAEFYGVSTDYLLCVTENRNPPNTGLTELHLSDDMVELLKSRRINNRLLYEIATHENFTALMTDAEIYGNGIATMRFPGNALDKFCYVMCSQLQISCEKLTEKERTDLKNIMKKSGIYKDSPLGSQKR